MKLSVFLFFSFLISISCSVETSDSRSVDIEAETIAKAEKVVESIKLLVIPDRRWNLTELAGKMPDVEGTYDFRQDIQLAIDSLAALGGGVLYFSHPDRKDFVKQILTYRIKGPIHLRSNIQLSFDTNLKLFFEFDPTAYMLPGGTLRRFEGTTIFSFSPLFYAFNEKNIALVFEDGHGVPARIDGDGMKWQAWENEVNKRRKEQGLPRSKNYVRKVNNQDVPLKDRRFTDIAMDAFRPDMISFFMCENILVDGLQLENSPFWVVHPIFSKNLTFRNISFDAPVYNNDGFDPESSKNILIENVMFNNHDDNVAIKAGRDKEGRDGVDVAGTVLEDIESEYIVDGRLGGPSENIVMRNSVFRGHHGVAIGSEMSGDVRNVYAHDNVAPQRIYSLLYLKSSRKRGGTIENVYMTNTKANRVESLVTLVPNYDGDTKSPHIPTFKNVFLSNTEVKKANHGIRIKGWSEQPLENILIEHCSIDSVENEEPMDISNVLNLNLSHVLIEGQLLNEVINKMDTTDNPRKVK